MPEYCFPNIALKLKRKKKKKNKSVQKDRETQNTRKKTLQNKTQVIQHGTVTKPQQREANLGYDTDMPFQFSVRNKTSKEVHERRSKSGLI